MNDFEKLMKNTKVEFPDEEKEYIDLLKKFQKEFGYGVPTLMIPGSISKKEIENAIKQCLEEHEDRLMEILNVGIVKGAIY